MRILCTGVSGFIGQHLFRELQALGTHEVFGLQRYVANRKPMGKNVFIGDIIDGDVYEVIHAIQPEIVLHLAALASNEQSNVFPVEAMRVNAVGTARMLRACQRIRQFTAFVLASSSEVFAKPGRVEALNAYAASKIAAEQAVRASGLPFVIARPFNTYGRGTIGVAKFVVDEAIVQAIQDGRIRLRDANPRRDFLFRRDHVRAYLDIVNRVNGPESGIMNQTFEFGTGQTHTIGEMALMVADLTGVQDVQFERKVRIGDIPFLGAETIDFTERILGWKAGYNLRSGLTQAVEEWRCRLGADSRQAVGATKAMD